MIKISDLVSDEFKTAVSDHLNRQQMFMNPRTGTVQSIEYWQKEKNSEQAKQFIEKELIEVKLINDKWVRVN